jgi:hypothetical protein
VVVAEFGRDGGYAPLLQHLLLTGQFDDVAEAAFEKFWNI